MASLSPQRWSFVCVSMFARACVCVVVWLWASPSGVKAAISQSALTCRSTQSLAVCFDFTAALTPKLGWVIFSSTSVKQSVRCRFVLCRIAGSVAAEAALPHFLFLHSCCVNASFVSKSVIKVTTAPVTGNSSHQRGSLDKWRTHLHSSK